MSLKLHRDGIAAILTTLTGVGAGKFAAGYKWPRRNLADPALKYPFWTLDSTITQQPEDYEEVGMGGHNLVPVTTKIQAFDRWADNEADYDAFVALHEAALTALRADANMRLGQDEDGCSLNRIVSNSITFAPNGTIPLIVSTIVCRADYHVLRT